MVAPTATTPSCATGCSPTSAFGTHLPSDLPRAAAASGSSTPSLCHSVTASLLHALIRADFDLSALLDDPRFTPDQVIAFLADADTQAKVADIAKIAHLGLTIRAAAARHVAIQTLEHVAKTTDDLVEKRRAATALLRATASPLVPLAKRATGCGVEGSTSALRSPLPSTPHRPTDPLRVSATSASPSVPSSPRPSPALRVESALPSPLPIAHPPLPPSPPRSFASSAFNPSSPLRDSALSASSVVSSPSRPSSSPRPADLIRAATGPP